MAVSRLKTWIAGETLTAADLNAEFNNILNNGQSVGFPRTGLSDFDANQLILDGDQDTHMTADTDDRIDFSLGGFDGIRFDGTTTSSVNGFDLKTQSTGVAPEIKSQGESNIGMELQDSNGNEILVLGSTASAVNEATITNAATGNAPQLQSSGESNIGLILADSNGNQALILGSTASAVNEITVTNAATSNGPSVAATGDDTNIPLTVSGKGTGHILLGQATSTDIRLAANQPIADSNGNEQIAFSATGSAVNELTVTNAATSNAPSLSATGDDTNISLNFVPKGTGTAQVGGSAFYPLQDGLGTEQATTSGTSIDFTGIRSDAHRITVIFEDVSQTGSGDLLVQIGDSGGVETTGYVSTGGIYTAASQVISTSTSGFVWRSRGSDIFSGHLVLTLIDGSTTWVASFNGKTLTTAVANGGGYKSLSGTLDRVRLTTTTGTDTFDNGNANILVE